MITAIILAVALIIQEQGLSTHAVMYLGGEIILNILLLQTWLPYQYINVSLNGVAWYLSTTMFLYCVFPYICKWIKFKNYLINVSVIVLFAEVVLCWVMLHFLGDEHPTYVWFMYCFPVFRVGDFFIGCCLGKSYHNKRLVKINPVKGTIVEVIAFVITAYIVVSPHNAMESLLYKAVWNWTTIYIVLASVWVCLFVCSEGILVKIITNKLFVFIGNISAYTFLIHYMVIQYVDRLVLYLGMTMSGWAMIVIMSVEMVITIMLTMAYFRFLKSKR